MILVSTCCLQQSKRRSDHCGAHRNRATDIAAFVENDADALSAILGDKEVNTFLPMFPLENVEEAKEYIRNKSMAIASGHVLMCHAICLKKDNVPVGYVCK